MKPFRAFLYIFSILTGFLVVSYFLEKVTLTEPGKHRQSPENSGNKEKTIISDSIISTTSDSPGILFSHLLDTTTRDSLLQNRIPEMAEKCGLQFPSGDTTVLYPFFMKLENRHASPLPLRILYFGDSQIENDRITSTIRKQFQQKFGGAGIGLIAPDMMYNLTHSFLVERSENWNIVNYSDIVDSMKNMSLTFKTAMLPPNGEGWFNIRQIRNKENPNDYLHIKIFFRSQGDFGIVVKDEENIIYRGKVGKTASVSALDFDFNFTPSGVSLYFQPTDSLELSAFSLETQTGVLVDNIALRGLSFPPFSKSDNPAMNEFAKLINPGLCVLHFGVNLAPNIQEDYGHYRDRLISEIRKIRQLFPDVPVLMIGISDMARKEGGQMVSYPNIKTIKAIQWEVAWKCNCAFWDLETFMGGAGSMIKWVNASPRLGQKDYIHFTTEGTGKVGKRLSELILTEYEKYLQTRSTP